MQYYQIRLELAIADPRARLSIDDGILTSIDFTMTSFDLDELLDSLDTSIPTITPHPDVIVADMDYDFYNSTILEATNQFCTAIKAREVYPIGTEVERALVQVGEVRYYLSFNVVKALTDGDKT